MSQNVSVCVKRVTHIRLTPSPIPPFLLSLPPFLLSPDRLSASLPLVGVEPFAVFATLVDLTCHRGLPPSGINGCSASLARGRTCRAPRSSPPSPAPAAPASRGAPSGRRRRAR